MRSRRLATFATSLFAAALAALVLLWAPSPGSGQVSTAVDLTAPVNAVNCNPCHARIAETDVRGLIFSHGNHLLVACTSCHIRAPHEAGVTYRPTMSTCFMCHGVRHGAQGILAAGECSDCHTPQHVLRPSTHVKNWAAKPHATTALKGGTNNCMMCHEAPKDCDACHTEKGLEIGPIPALFLRNLPVEAERPSVPIDTRGVPTVGSCVFCHPSIDRTANGRITFVHDPHLKRDYRCSACHASFPHNAGRTSVPDMQSCYRCHSLNHGKRGEFAPQQCLACHPRSFPLKPINHTVAFSIGGHKKDAAAEISTCTMCHESSFCVPCHNAGKKLANGAKSPKVIPADHRKAEWRPDHGRKYLAQTGSCSVCHAAVFCTDCHITAMPHPPNWVARHAQKGYPTDDCEVCHTDRESCQACHHSSLGSQELIAENCVKCHEEMKTQPPTKIKNMPLVEHAVHFNVKKRVGRNYVCDDCHIGFTVARVMQPASQTQAHDMRLCYDCHGNLSTSNTLIAPYPGSELCRRCHKDLKI